jgi:DNA polymerase-3 subunit gamma/tau
MSYLVLARKWRPQVFEDVVGQRPITQTLQNAISQNRVAHAFLFTGARGVGKTSTARILAKALNCEAGAQVNPCNQCRTCQEISSGSSMDVIEIDGASNRGIDEIRELRENVRYTPAKSRYKIFIIDEVHMLTREAFNALLKTLEEPPPRILFVFATTEPHKIPATILSRCQRYDFKRIPLKEIVQILSRIITEEQIQLSEGALLTIARESDGSMRDAQSLLDQVISYGGKVIQDEEVIEALGLIDRKILLDTLEAIASRDAGRCMDLVEQIYHFGYDLQHFCRELLQYLRHLMLLKVSRNPGPLVALPKEELELLGKQAERFQFDQLNYLFSLLLKGEEEVAQSTFPRTMLEMTLIRMATLRPIRTLEEILKKLNRLSTSEPAAGGERKNLQRSVPEPREENGLSEKPAADPIPPLAEPVQEHREAESKGDALKKGDVGDREVSPAEGENSVSSATGVEEAWKALVVFARARNPIIGAFLAMGEPIDLSLDRVEIGFEKDSFHYERMQERENRDLLEQICHGYFQREAKVIITAVDQKPRMKGEKAAENRGGPSSPREKSLEKGNGKQALIQEALRLFNGKIVEE